MAGGLLIASAITTLAATGISAYGQIQQGRSAEKIADYNAKVANNNAIAARQQADFQADRFRDRARRLAGSQRAAFSKSGIELSGSASDVMFDSAVETELDALTAIYKGEVSANSSTAQAEIFKLRGDSAKQGSQFAAAGTILGGLSQAAGLGATAANSKRLDTAVKNNPQLDPFGN